MADEDYPTESRFYKIIKTIGSGDNTTVIQAVCTPLERTMVAIKIIDRKDSKMDCEDFKRQAEVMKEVSVRMGSLSLSHPHILTPHCSFTVKSRRWIVMPFMSGGSLQSIIASSHPNGLPMPFITAVLNGILKALSYLHDHSRMHMRIKAGNILVHSDGSVKLGDCGASSSLLDFNMWSAMSTMPTDVIEKPYWVAPEVIHSCVGYTFKADIWGLGVTALELAYGRPPLSHPPLSKTMKMEISKRFRFSDPYDKMKPSESKKFSELFESVVGLCLDHDPSRRPTAMELLTHPFFKNCNEPHVLIKDFLQELPPVNMKLKSSSKSSDCDEEVENVNHTKISGWKFNKQRMELDPIFHLDDSVGDAIEGRGGIEGSDFEQILCSLGLMRDTVDDLLRKVDELIDFVGGEVLLQTTSEEDRAVLETEMKMLCDLEKELQSFKQQLVETTKEEGIVDLMMELENKMKELEP